MYKDSYYIFVYGLGFDAGDSRCLSMLDAVETCAKTVADSGAAAPAAAVTIDYFPYLENDKSKLLADEGTVFTARATGFDTGSRSCEWYINGKQQKSDPLEPLAFHWVPGDDEWLPEGTIPSEPLSPTGKGEMPNRR